uniref:Uncharacterized protein n=1 Tax=Leersia perrieri TaxID=77586 RepID=A0A0D9WLV8_9ORYZ
MQRCRVMQAVDGAFRGSPLKSTIGLEGAQYWQFKQFAYGPLAMIPPHLHSYKNGGGAVERGVGDDLGKQ